MQITVLLDERGRIIGTMRRNSDSASSYPSAGFVPERDQTVREVELPEAVDTSLSAAELHRIVEEALAREGGPYEQ